MFRFVKVNVFLGLAHNAVVFHLDLCKSNQTVNTGGGGGGGGGGGQPHWENSNKFPQWMTTSSTLWGTGVLRSLQSGRISSCVSIASNKI